ncbi:MAG: hypothetical protein Q4E55_09385, partial [Bacteroidales bacterium]|nr:hypothetical protein [Bacteroidales bacterium]
EHRTGGETHTPPIRQFGRKSGLFGDPVEKPGGAVHPVHIIGLVCDTPALAVALKVLQLGQVPLLREDKLAAFLNGSIQISRIGVEAKVLVQRTSVLVGIAFLPILTDGERLGGSVLIDIGLCKSFVIYFQ